MRPMQLLPVILLGGGLFAVGMQAAAETPGDAERGRTVFTSKECSRCHVPRGQQGVGPALEVTGSCAFPAAFGWKRPTPTVLS